MPKDPDAAKAQFERAAAKNQGPALYNLGVMALDSSSGRKPDFSKAAQYFLRSANAGDDDGAYSYGVMLREGRGVPQDIAEGARWLKRAADAGVIAGQVEYAIMLFNGEGVPKDQAAAVAILRVAAAKGIRSPRTALRIFTWTAWWWAAILRRPLRGTRSPRPAGCRIRTSTSRRPI